MSGTNPFRHKPRGPHEQHSNASVHNAQANSPEARIPPIDTDFPRSPRPRTGKTVRIISPHSATSDDKDGIQHIPFPPPRDFTSSPPPDTESATSLEDAFADSFNADWGDVSTGDEGTRQNTLTNSGSPCAGSGDVTVMSANPFEKTLASLSTESTPEPPNISSERLPPETDSRTSCRHYDVDDFKRLLLTGKKSVSGANVPAAPPASFHNQHQAGDSSSNTDASSISRQSIFEPVSGPLQDSPRTSRGSSPSDDERRRLVVSVSERIKPATPRHRHGKLVKANAPLTVSFEDPALSFSSPTSAAIRAVRATPKSPGTPSASDKPLPPLPPSGNATTSAESRCMSIEINKRNSYFASQDAYDSPTTQKRKPPEPPLSRRHSQLRGKSLTSNPEQPIPISEEDPDFSSTPSRSPSASSSRSPPVPPPPRSGPIRGGSSSSMATSISFTEASDQSSNVGMSANPSKTRPPVPPNRSPSISSIKRPTQRQRVAGSPSMAPPPPPPPRRRGSSQSSYTPSRLSGDHRSAARECFGSDCGTSSISEIHTTSLAPTGTENVMADLSALQKEVDELRGRFK